MEKKIKIIPDKLLNKPLVEAIFELQWELKQEANRQFDPNFPVFVGRFYDKIQDKYSEREDLPICQFADILTPFSVRHRFRSKDNSWPLTQIGPGIVSINDTKDYKWEKFSIDSQFILDKTFEAYPTDIQIKSLSLRYINAIPLSEDFADLIEFISNNFEVQIGFKESIFTDSNILPQTQHFKMEMNFKNDSNSLELVQSFQSGFLESKNALIWTIVAKSIQFNKEQKTIQSWLEEAHLAAKSWFFSLCKENLLKKFQPVYK